MHTYGYYGDTQELYWRSLNSDGSTLDTVYDMKLKSDGNYLRLKEHDLGDQIEAIGLKVKEADLSAGRLRLSGISIWGEAVADPCESETVDGSAL